MENQNINIDEMRNQIAILKQKLECQEIVNDHLLRETMRARVGDIDKTKRLEYVCCVICLGMFPLYAYMGIISAAFAIATTLMILLCLFCTMYIHQPVDRIDLMTEDLVTVARVMSRFKSHYDFWLHYVTPALIIPWLAWACYEFALKFAPEGINPLFCCLPLVIGAAIGGFIGYTYHRKAVNAAKSIIDQIEDV